MARPDKTKALERLRKALDAIDDLVSAGPHSPVFHKWIRNTKLAISHTFGETSDHVEDFNRIGVYARVYAIYGIDITKFNHKEYPEDQKNYLEELESASMLLELMIEEIEEYWEPNQISSSSTTQESSVFSSKNIFIVHGRDEGIKNTVARFLERLKLEPVILNEEASRGKTIIEKFEHHADVGFAVVLLTPDDEGALQGGESGPSPRARQNVIFELGYFIGRLGRKRACALTKGSDLEIPSDYAGVVYIPLDDQGAWKMGLVRELKKAGFDVDANRAL